MIINEFRGDLFKLPITENLAHCVSADLVMSKGIALLFKKKFGGIDELKSQNLKVGDVGVLKIDSRFIYYLISKLHYFDKPSYATLEQSLQSLKKHCIDHHVTKLSIPKIGCGLDCLKWDLVKQLLEKIFADTNLEIVVYSLD